MASAIMGGLIHQGQPASQIESGGTLGRGARALRKNYGIEAQAEAGPATLQRAGIVVWAVKPKPSRTPPLQTKAHTQAALHLSVAAGIRSDSIAQWLGSERVVRTMPNTPARWARACSALYARPAVTAAERQSVEAIMASTHEFLWVESEKQLDAVTALQAWQRTFSTSLEAHGPRGRGAGGANSRRTSWP